MVIVFSIWVVVVSFVGNCFDDLYDRVLAVGDQVLDFGDYVVDLTDHSLAVWQSWP